ncbi:MAG: hypothetical protein U0270_06045 [Labilithrix sp.]
MSDESSDEAARLVEADALLAKGDPRGELIIVQCALARGGLSRERGIALRRREQELLVHADHWANLEGLARDPVFRGGFVDEIVIPIDRFIEHEEEIWRRAPRLRWLHFIGLRFDSPVDELGDAAREWHRAETLLERALESGRVRSFSARDAQVSWMVDGQIRYRESGSLAPSIVRWLQSDGGARLERLRGLGLDDVGPDTMLTLARAPLEEVEVRGRLFADAAELREAFATSRLRPRRLLLEHWPSNVSRDESAALRELLRSPLGANLVDLVTSQVTPVLESGRAAQLRSLRVTSLFDAEPLAAIAGAPELASLEHLAADGNFGARLDYDPEPLYAPRHLEALRTLRVGARLDPNRARRLVCSPLAQRLELIDLRASKDRLAAHASELRRLWDGVILV